MSKHPAKRSDRPFPHLIADAEPFSIDDYITAVERDVKQTQTAEEIYRRRLATECQGDESSRLFRDLTRALDLVTR